MARVAVRATTCSWGDCDINDDIAAREVFQWDRATDPDGTDRTPGIDDGDKLCDFGLNTGIVDVTFKTTAAGGRTEFGTNSHLVNGVLTDGAPANSKNALGQCVGRRG